MSDIGWRFPPLSGGSQQGYTDNDIEAFKGQEIIDNLTREICQNSLDAHLDKSDSPVKVVFELKHIDTYYYDVISQYSDCLAGCRAYWKDEMDIRLSRFVSIAEKTLNEKTIPILIASDYNTKGLVGNHSNKISTPWKALTSSDGVSVKNDADSAGSYGIGKNAPFACSSLSMVFYNTLDENNESAFIGVARLATLLNKSNKPTQNVGKYQVNDEEHEVWTPIYPEHNCKFRDSFLRTACGTDVIIVGFTHQNNWIKNVTKAIMRNFFIAISEGRLVVELKDNNDHKIIDSYSISELFSEYAEDPEMISTTQLYKAFVSPDNKASTTILENDDVEVYIKADSNYKRTIANFRATGMLVGTYYKRIFQHYAAVVIVRGSKLGELLKDTEPPRHNRWDYKQIEHDNDKRKNAKKSIKQIEDFVLSLLKSQFEVVTEDAVDAAGVGEYIPDEQDDFGGQSEGKDILKAKIKIGRIKANPPHLGSAVQVGISEEGIPKDGVVHNKERNPKPIPHPHPPKPVIPDSDIPIPYPGATPGNGTKTITDVNLSAQRAFPIDVAQGLYKIIVKPTEKYNNLFVECFAVGEDGQSDALELESFKLSGMDVEFSGGKAGPIKLEADTPAIFYACFRNKEKMKISLHLTEVIDK